MSASAPILRLAAAAILGTGVLSSPAPAQEPSGAAGGVAIEFGGESVPGDKSARERARDYLASKGLNEGWNAEKRLWIGIGSATIAQLPGKPEWDVARYLAFQKACADAKTKAVERMGAAVAASMESASKTGTDLNEAKKKAFADANQEGARQLGVIDKVAAIIEAEVDKEYKARVPDATAEPTPEEKAAREDAAARRRRELTQDLLKDARFRSAVSVVAKEELCGMQCFRTFEEIPPGKQGTIAVIMACNDASLALAAALMGKNPVPPAGAPGTARSDTKAWANALDRKTLLYTMGCQIRQNEKGEVVLVSFGQSTPTVDDEDLQDDARDGASLTAFEEARRFVGELVETRGTLSREQQMRIYRQEGMEGVDKEVSVRKDQARDFAAKSEALMMRGGEDIREWDQRHPLSQVPTFGVIRVFSLSGALAALDMREDMQAVGGSKGGAGVVAPAGGKAAAGVPRAPSGLKLVPGDQGARLAWDDNSANESGFRIEQSMDEGKTWKVFRQVNEGIRSCPLPALGADKKAWYQVRAFNAAGQSAPAGPVAQDGSGAPVGGPHGGSSGAGAEPDLP